jgi:hypothetical protein
MDIIYDIKFTEYKKIIYCLYLDSTGTRKNIHQIWNFTKCRNTILYYFHRAFSFNVSQTN